MALLLWHIMKCNNNMREQGTKGFNHFAIFAVLVVVPPPYLQKNIILL